VVSRNMGPISTPIMPPATTHDRRAMAMIMRTMAIEGNDHTRN
jgi:hypothetical protein